MSESSDATVVGFWFDQVSPYPWTASRWLREAHQRDAGACALPGDEPVLLNERPTVVAPPYRRDVEASRGPGRVATAAATRFGSGILEGL